jgi:hypothetical protein
MSNDIRTILEKLTVLENRITPVNVKHGLNADQKSVKQLPALFKPKTQKILGGDPNAKNPMGGWLVGDSVETDKEPVEEEIAEAVANEEKLLDKVKKSLTDYLASIEDKYKDADIKEKKKDDRDLGKKAADRDLLTKEKVKEDPTQENPVTQAATIPDINPTYAESSPVKTIAMEDGRVCEIHGNEKSGFEIRHGNRSLKTRFRNLDEAEMAFEMFCSRMKQQDQSADYIDEA